MYTLVMKNSILHITPKKARVSLLIGVISASATGAGICYSSIPPGSFGRFPSSVDRLEILISIFAAHHLHFLHKQICLVYEENYRDMADKLVIDKNFQTAYGYYKVKSTLWKQAVIGGIL